MTAIAQSRFDMMRVAQNMFGILGRNIAPFAILSLVLGGIPGFLQQFFAAGRMIGVVWWVAMLTTVAFAVLKMVTAFVLQGSLVAGAISDLNGKRIDLGAMVARGGAVALPLLALAIVQGIGVGIGFILLVIPGLYLATIWSVSVPALVIENTGMSDAFKRSSELTKGFRWPVFGLMIGYGVLAWIVSGVGGVLMGIAAGGSLNVALNGSIPASVVAALVGAAQGALAAAGVAALYYELRLNKEGTAPQALAETFA